MFHKTNLLLKKATLKEETRTLLGTQNFFALLSRANKTDFLFAYTRLNFKTRKHTRAKTYNGGRGRLSASQSSRNLFKAHGAGMFP